MIAVYLMAVLGGAGALGLIASFIRGSSSTDRFEGYLREIERNHRQQLPPASEPKAAATELPAEEPSGLKSRLQGALHSLNQPGMGDPSSDSVSEPKRPTDQNTTPRDGTDR